MSYTFTTANNERTITGWSGNNNVINIQLGTSTLNIKIANSAFFNKGYTFQLTDLVLPPTVIQIGNNSYNSASGINGTINLSSTTVTYIGDSAFMNCTGLTGPLSLSTLNLTYIGNSAFNGCRQLNALTLPSSLTYLGAAAFNDCSGLTGPLDLSGLSLTVINNTAFRNCSGLTNLTLPNTLISINEQTFQNCNGLTGLLNLSTLTNLTSIGVSSFQNCSKITSLALPNSLINISNYVFNNCYGLTGALNLSTLNNLINIGSNVFQNCSNLTSLALPNNVETIGFGAFMNCNGLTGTLPLSNLTKLTSIGNDVFNTCNQLTSITFPTSLVTIGIRSFYNCSILSGAIDLSSTQVTTVGENAFRSCAISSLIFPTTLTSLGRDICLNTPFTSVYFQSGCTLQTNTFSSSTTAIVYAERGSQFTIGTASGSFSTTSNPLVNYFSKWRLYNQPYPTTDSFFSSSVNTFYKDFTPGTDFTFYTYNVNTVTYTVVVKDANGDVVIIDQPTIIQTGYLYTFSYELPNGLPSGSKTITLNNILVLNLIELACSSFGPLSDSYNAGEIIIITWTGTYPPYSLSFNGPGIAPRPIVTNWILNIYNYPIPLGSIQGKYNISVTNSNSCVTYSKSFYIVPCITITPMEAYYYDFITVSWVSFRASYTVTLIGENGSEQVMGTTDLKTLTWGITTFTTPGLYQVQVSSTDGFCTALSNRFLIVELQDICFVKDTLVETDQGNIPIQSIVPGKHTVFNQKIIDITKTIHPDSHLVHIKAFAFGPYPTKDTTVSQEHKINGVGSFREARHYVNGTTVTLVPYDFQPLYNVLLIRPGFMRVHGMMVETLDPYVMKHEPKRPLLKR